jgi:hypothetical protein
MLAVTTSLSRSYSISLANLVPSGRPIQDVLRRGAKGNTDLVLRQVRQGIASNTKGTAFVVYEDVMDAKMACDKLNGFNFQNRYLVGKQRFPSIVQSFLNCWQYYITNQTRCSDQKRT